MQAKMIDRVDLEFGFGCSIFGCLAGVGVHSRIVDPDMLTLGMITPGAAAAVAGNGVFNQSGNSMSLRGILDVTASGLASGQVPEGPQTLDTTAALDLNDCVLTSDGTTLTLKVPVDYTGRFLLDAADPNTFADVRVQTAFTGSSGFIVATAPAISNIVEESLVVTAGLDVTPVNDLPSATPESFVTRQGVVVTVAATAVQSTEELISPGATWRYRYDGQDLGTAWRAWNYDDEDWSSGQALLGHGPDADIVTNIRPPGTPNRPTAYFRRGFTLYGLSNTPPGVKLFVKRDDAAAVFINGVEVFRDGNLAANADFDDFATANLPDSEENLFIEVPLSRTVLFEGRNVIAVEVHQSSVASTDLRFDLRLTREFGAPGVLANDSDIDTLPNSLSATVIEAPANGWLDLRANGGFVYRPFSGFSGDDSFVYQVGDGDEAKLPMKLVPRGSTWKYLADGTDPGPNWRLATFDDQSWPVGTAELGYGDEPEGRPEATNIRPDPVNTPIFPSYYFRMKFTLPTDVALVSSLVGRILRDDAAAVYLNGDEVYRDTNLAASATASDFATGGTPSETDYPEFSIDPAALDPGENVLAVEVHQATAASSDVSFDFELEAMLIPGARVDVHVLDDDQDGDAMADTWERQNALDYTAASDAAIDSDGDGSVNRFEFLADTDPHDAGSRFEAVQVSRSGDNLNVGFSPVSTARSYQIECSDSLGGWTNYGPVIVPGGTIYSVAIPIDGSAPARYCRLKVLYTFP